GLNSSSNASCMDPPKRVHCGAPDDISLDGVFGHALLHKPGPFFQEDKVGTVLLGNIHSSAITRVGPRVSPPAFAHAVTPIAAFGPRSPFGGLASAMTWSGQAVPDRARGGPAHAFASTVAIGCTW